MEITEQFVPKVLKLYMEISLYPVLSHTIREQMRQELFSRGIIHRDDFDKEVYQKAVESQKREGLIDPLIEEPATDWNKRVSYIRAHLTDFYFAYNLPYALFERILQETLEHRRVPNHDVRLSFNPEIAPWDVLFSEGERLEHLPPEELTRVRHHLREIVVVLIKAMISDHLSFVGLAKEVFTIADLKAVRDRRIGRGKIGGKAAGMLLAWKLLQQAGEGAGFDPSKITIPDSYYIGSDVFYEVQDINDFYPFMNQKYKSREEIIADYPLIYENYRNAQLPGYVVDQLRALLEQIGPMPLIFRSSSLLEDSFATSFAGKYDSYFLANQGTPEENLAAAKEAVLKIFASTVSPDALIYRQRKGLIDFDERMAILIQKVAGQRYGRYYYPMLAGVGFSRNPFRWSQKIRREDGLLRLVCGLGTRAVDRGDRDYPRMIALSHPQLRPETRIEQLRQYSQRLIDVLDVEENDLKTLPIADVIGADYPALRMVAAVDNGQYLQPFIRKPTGVDPSSLVFTFDTLAQNKTFTNTMRNMLAFLQKRYERPVDIEYAIDVPKAWPQPEFDLCLLQCRPLSQHESEKSRRVPQDVPAEDRLFSANRQIPEGVIEQVRYIVYVRPETYNLTLDLHNRLEVGRVVGRLNERLKDATFVLMGPGRWGTSDVQLGVKVSYADIYNSCALIEVAFVESGCVPEMAYGTHFFQDLVESKIFPLALFPSEPGNVFNQEFFENAPNVLADLSPKDAGMTDLIKVIDVPIFTGGKYLEIIMDADHDEALGYLKRYE